MLGYSESSSLLFARYMARHFKNDSKVSVLRFFVGLICIHLASTQLLLPYDVNDVAGRSRIGFDVANIESRICVLNEDRPVFQSALSCPEQSEHNQIH